MAVTVQVPNKSEILTPILDYQRIRDYSAVRPPDAVRLDEILAKARELKGLEDFEAAQLMAIDNPDGVEAVLRTAAFVKEEIYGVRMVLFAPIYVGNKCANDCLYCGFRSENKDLRRVTLSTAELEDETRALLRQGHKRLLLLTGESRSYNVEFTMRALETIYGVEENGAGIRRINVEVAPMSVEDFRVLKSGRIGTYTCFQETYDPSLYKTYHQKGPKADYGFRLSVMDRAMEAGIDDVGVGVLFGLAPWRQEVISLLNHARHLDKRWGCGPHTISVPRLEPAPGAPLTRAIPYPVSDAEFRLIVAVLRLTVPYTGIILSTRESKTIRDDLFRYGVSQASAGSKTTPGAYNKGNGKTPVGEYTHSQFSLADHRSLHEVVSDLVDGGFVPSFCTGCYRQGRTGADFMDLAKPGLIKRYCLPNGLSSFAEYLEEYADETLRKRGYALISRLGAENPDPIVQQRITAGVKAVQEGCRDVYV